MSDSTDDKDKDLSDIQNTDDTIIPEKPRNQPYDVPLDELLSDEVKKFSDEEIKKIKQISYGALGIALLIAVLAIYSCQPKKGSMAYGICSTFLELITPYPHTITHIGLEGSLTSVRIYFTNIDPFGEFKQEMIECKFSPDESGGRKLAEVLRNRRPVDPDVVRKFNMTLPIVMTSDPYVVLPPDWKNQLLPENR